MHLGTAVALLVYFWRDWLDSAERSSARAARAASRTGRLCWKVVVATIPAVIIGFPSKHLLHKGFGAPKLAAGFLIVNGVMLFVAERLRAAPRGCRSRWAGATP